MKRLTDITRLFAEAARSARPDAVVVFHSWPKPDNLPFYDGTLNEIYANRPWRFTLWKRAEFSNWGDVFAVPSLVNIYLRQEPWGGEKREVTSEVEARHLYWQALANGAYPNAWGYLGAERPFAVMKAHADCFDFPTTFPTRFLALPRPMFADARHQQIARETQIPLRAGKVARLRIWEREPNGRIDLLCLRADGKPPADDEYRAFAAGRKTPGVLFLDAAGFDPARSVVAAGGGRWQCEADAQALSGKCLTSTGHALAGEPRMPLEFALPAIEAAGPWSLWARVRFPNVGADSFYWQVSSDDGRTWFPEKPRDECAVGWEQPQQYGWVRARMDLPSRWGADVDRFLSPPAGMFAGLLHAGIPVKQMHPNHITAKSLEGFRVLVLANEVALSDAQCRAIREFVRAGGGLIATHETSLYDLDARRRRNFGLADVFGVSLAGMAEPAAGQALLPQGEMLRGVLPAAGLPNREEHLLVRATTAKVVATLAGAGWPTSAAPAPVRPAGAGAPAGGAPAVLLNTFGKGRVVYLPGRPDSSYSRWADAGTPALIRFAVQWAAPGGIPAAVDSPDGPVGVTCFDQPARNRRLVHLVAYNADGSKPFDALPPLENVKVTLSAPAGKRIASVRAVLSGESLAVQSAGGTAQVVLKRLQEYEVLEVKWGGG